MSIEKVEKYFSQFGIEDRIIEFQDSSATVELAAERLGVKGQRIAKTLSFVVADECVLVVAAGDAKVDNQKYRTQFGAKPKMLKGDQVKECTGYDIGGVCPFDNPDGVKTYMDISMKRFETIFPACGSASSAVEMTPEELFTYGKGIAWVDVCKAWNESEIEE